MLETETRGVTDEGERGRLAGTWGVMACGDQEREG